MRLSWTFVEFLRQCTRSSQSEGGIVMDGVGWLETSIWSRRPESNRDLALRRRSFYPLNYGEISNLALGGIHRYELALWSADGESRNLQSVLLHGQSVPSGSVSWIGIGRLIPLRRYSCARRFR
jgi:hypothetical protein